MAVASTAAAWQADGSYDAAVDFLDGADQIGFTVAEDPWELGPIPIGTDSYSQDDYFPYGTLGQVSNVDLRAVVRYPATVAGAGTPVAAGTHPLFIVEHGNHFVCRVVGSTRANCPALSRLSLDSSESVGKMTIRPFPSVPVPPVMVFSGVMSTRFTFL